MLYNNARNVLCAVINNILQLQVHIFWAGRMGTEWEATAMELVTVEHEGD